MRDLSVIIAARNEEFLARTVEGVLEKKRANTEIIVICDGNWPNPPIKDHPDVTIVYHPVSVGQRAAVNEGARLSQAKFIMKLDAHCILDEGFDVKLMADCEYDWTVIPRMYNLHAFDWVCTKRNETKCDGRIYQGPSGKLCPKCGAGMEREMIWQPRWNRQSDFMRFDKDLHFQYWGDYRKRPEAQGDICDVMSFIGACFFINRKRYWDLDGLDEEHGSWGQMGTELSCKTWLSGGRLVVNKKTWFSHMFRTQGADFGFPYPLSGAQTDHARRYSQDMWRNGKWKKAIRKLDWIIDKFKPVPGWEENDMKKGIIYYTDNQLKLSIAHACKKNIKSMGLPITSASLKPMTDMGKNVVINMKRGYRAYFTQILAALEASDAEIVYFCEHDWLYHPSHFEFTPSRKDTFYYNWNWWRVRVADGHCVRYDTQMVPGIVAYRELLIQFYKEVIEQFEKLVISEGSEAKAALLIGFEPGTSKRIKLKGEYRVERFDSTLPILDLRHTSNLTASKWTQDAFRSPKNCTNWQESTTVSGWGIMKDVLKELKIT